MKYNSSRRKKTNRSTFIFGIIFTVALFFTLAFTASLILSTLKNPLGASGMASFLVLLLTGAISGFFTAKYKGDRGVVPAGLCAMFFALILFGSGLIASDGKIATVTVVNLLSYISMAFIFAAFAKKKRRPRRSRQ